MSDFKAKMHQMSAGATICCLSETFSLQNAEIQINYTAAKQPLQHSSAPGKSSH